MTGVRRRPAALLALAVLLGASVALSLAVGSRSVALGTVLDVLRHPGGALAATTDGAVVLTQRLPRTVLGLAVGAALGVAGALVQAVTRNPLADPGILGVTAGASFAAAVAVGVLGASATGGGVWAALLGALLASVLVQLVGSSAAGSRGRGSPVQLLLAGLALGAVLAGLTSALRLSDPEAFSALTAWESGVLADRGWSGLVAVAPLLAVGLVVALVLTPALNAIALGDDLAAALGARVWLVRASAVLAVTLLAGGATAAAGPIAFVGLMVPHAVRWMVGPDQRWVVATCAFAAPVLLLLADVLGRVVLRPGELPAGVVTAALGAPVLVALVRRARVSAP